ncbi:NAD-dependent epimerase/dehydratase family protein [Actinomadura sp.]|jgi:nucleoside-diphosphate-sugar epimerase|uniref:NAD-dependent epimerase/dehydratase family protein n=1 Tax=Actinomadura sp. TaxID=1989 RepID=UPI0037C98B89
MTTTLVTGGLGFVGRYLVRRLAADGHRVISYNRDFSESDDPSVVAVQGELYDVPRLLRTLQEYEVERIAHTAAMSHPELSIDLPITTFTANVEGTLHVLEAARLAGVRRVVNFSSECAYGDQETHLVQEEGAHLLPNTPYGVTKVATELMGRVYGRLYGVDVISLRITEVYGPGNPMPEVLREMIAAAVHGRPFRLDEGGEHRFQFVHAEDVARAAQAALEVGDHGRAVYNITGGRQVTLREAAALVEKILGKADLAIGPGHIPTLDRQGPYDITAARDELGYVPQQSLEAGIASYADWLRDRRY